MLRDYFETSAPAARIKIQVVNRGILAIPQGRNWWEMPVSHFEKRIEEKGYMAIIRALNNLQVWLRNSDPEKSKKAKALIGQLQKMSGRNESSLAKGYFFVHRDHKRHGTDIDKWRDDAIRELAKHAGVGGRLLTMDREELLDKINAYLKRKWMKMKEFIKDALKWEDPAMLAYSDTEEPEEPLLPEEAVSELLHHIPMIQEAYRKKANPKKRGPKLKPNLRDLGDPSEFNPELERAIGKIQKSAFTVSQALASLSQEFRGSGGRKPFSKLTNALLPLISKDVEEAYRLLSPRERDDAMLPTWSKWKKTLQSGGRMLAILGRIHNTLQQYQADMEKRRFTGKKALARMKGESLQEGYAEKLDTCIKKLKPYLELQKSCRAAKATLMKGDNKGCARQLRAMVDQALALQKKYPDHDFIAAKLADMGIHQMAKDVRVAKKAELPSPKSEALEEAAGGGIRSLSAQIREIMDNSPARAKLSVALSYVKRGKYEKAIDELENALRLISRPRLGPHSRWKNTQSQLRDLVDRLLDSLERNLPDGQWEGTEDDSDLVEGHEGDTYAGAMAELAEYQVASGLAYMRRKAKRNKPYQYKSLRAHKAAMKRWRKYGPQIIMGIVKARNSGKGKMIAKALANYLKKRNKGPGRQVAGLDEVLPIITGLDARNDLQDAFPAILEHEEVLTDLAMVFCPDDLLALESLSSYQAFVVEFLEERDISPLDMTLVDWVDLKDFWSRGDVLMEANSNPIAASFTPKPKKIGDRMYGQGKCEYCSEIYYYPTGTDDPKLCRNHGGVMSLPCPSPNVVTTQSFISAASSNAKK